MGLLDGVLSEAFASAFSSIFLDATLYRWSTTEDGKGGGVGSFAIGEPVKAQLDATTQAMERAQGFVDTDQRILVLASGVDPISTDDEIEVPTGGQRWAIASVSRDPAGAYYDLRGRRASVAAPAS